VESVLNHTQKDILFVHLIKLTFREIVSNTSRRRLFCLEASYRTRRLTESFEDTNRNSLIVDYNNTDTDIVPFRCYFKKPKRLEKKTISLIRSLVFAVLCSQV